MFYGSIPPPPPWNWKIASNNKEAIYIDFLFHAQDLTCYYDIDERNSKTPPTREEKIQRFKETKAIKEKINVSGNSISEVQYYVSSSI